MQNELFDVWRGRSFSRRLISATAVVAVFGLAVLTPVTGRSASEHSPVEAGTSYLISEQGDSGLWSVDTPRERIDTAACITALQRVGGPAAEMAALRAQGSLLLSLPAELETTIDLILEFWIGNAEIGFRNSGPRMRKLKSGILDPECVYSEIRNSGPLMREFRSPDHPPDREGMKGDLQGG